MLIFADFADADADFADWSKIDDLIGRKWGSVEFQRFYDKRIKKTIRKSRSKMENKRVKKS